MSTLYDGQYILKLIRVHADDEKDIAVFAREWAAKLYAEYSACLYQPFLLRIGERHAGQDEPDWIAELCPRGGIEDKLPDLGTATPFLRLDAQQSYFARNQDDPTANYAGRVEVSVIAPQLEGEEDRGSITRSAEFILLRLAFSHYTECISQHYLRWDTAYLDAPVTTERQLSSNVTADNAWV